ncbi:MAG TPA: hypothetical protein VFX76_05460, partial [Roseiflexaceae bacterium]|nr:hypothetical protein [Roseiflexaceae bacterium]
MSDVPTLANLNGSDNAEEQEIIGLTSKIIAQAGDHQMIERFKQRLARARATADRSGESMALLVLGVLYNRLAEERRAIGCLELAIAAAHELGEQRREGQAQIHLGNTHNQLGNARGALKCYAQGLAIVRAIGDRL